MRRLRSFVAAVRPAQVAALGVLLLLLFWLLRLEKLVRLVAGEPPGSWPVWIWPGLFAVDAGFVLAFEAVWLGLLSAPAKALRAAGRWLLLPSHLVVVAAALLCHEFFLATGHRLHFDLAAYALGRIAMLAGVLSVGFDVSLGVRLGLALSCVLLVWLRFWERPGGRLPLARAGATLAVGLLLFLVPWVREPRRAEFARNEVAALLGGALRSLGDGPSVVSAARAPAEWYREPVVAARGEDPRPSIVLVILESTGWGAVESPGGGWRRDLPAIAALAEEGLVADRAYASVTHTSKALVGILCGVPPRTEMEIVEAFEGNLPMPCLPELLAGLGYRSAFLQTALGRFENRPGLVGNLGFQEGAYQETLARPPFQRLGYLGMDEFAMLEPALEWVRLGNGRPFLLTLLTVTPHHPYQSPGTSLREALAAPRQAYREALRHQDRFLGALLEGLRVEGVLEEAVVIVLGDHGEAFGEHRRNQHDAVPYEEVVRIPWVLRAPAWLGAPRRVGGLRHHVDLLPTLLDLLEVEWEGLLPGRSLLSSPGHERVFSHCWYENFCVAMREGQLKYVHHFGRRPTEVFDLERDPMERLDLAPTLPRERVAAAERKILGHRLSLDALWALYPVHRGSGDWWLGGLGVGDG